MQKRSFRVCWIGRLSAASHESRKDSKMGLVLINRGRAKARPFFFLANRNNFAPRAASGNIASPVQIRVHFYSYCKDLAGSDSVAEDIEPGSPLGDLLQKIFLRFPKLAPVQKSLLVAVGVDYQGGDYVLQEGDEVSLFPPVQGG